MEKVVINPEACVGCGMCVSQNPEYIVFNDQGRAEAIGKEIKSEDKNNILESIEICPTEAICIVEEK